MQTIKRTILTTTIAMALQLGAVSLNAGTLSDLLVEKGLITASEAASVSSGDETSLVNLLVSKGVISNAEATALKTVAPAPVPAPQAEKSFVVKAKDKAVKSIQISGRIQGQLDALSTSYDNASDPNSETNLFLRRVYLGVSASFTDNLKGVFNANFANDGDGVGEIEKAIIEYGFSDNHTLAVGYQKTPIGYEETTSSSKIKAVERSVATRYFTEQLDLGARHNGIYVEGEYDSGLYFTVAATDPEQGDVSSSSATDKIALWGQVGWEGDVGAGSLDIGAAVAHIPETLSSGDTDMIWNAYANYKAGNFAIMAELLGAKLEGYGDAKPLGYTIQPTFKINSDFELVARYSSLDADGGIGADISSTSRRAPENGGAKYDDVSAYYIGGNWYIRGNTLKLSAGYEWANYDDNLSGSQGDADVDGFRTRLQILF